VPSDDYGRTFVASILERVLRVGEGRTLRRLENYAAATNALEDDFQALSDEELKHETVELRERYANGESLDDLLPEAFAAVREASRRTLGLRHFDVQIMGGAALHLGNIAEMKTGEGKTLTGAFPVYLNAIAGKGVHVVTVNDFLASYQSELMGRVFRALGMTTGCIVAGQTPAVRREQYAADITYGTNNEFGFDYLRDNMAWQATDMVQRGHNFAIVDEVDSILIDEARTPLIISGPSSGEANRWFTEFANLAKRLLPGEDYEVDEKKRTVGVLEPGIEKVEDYLGIDNLYESANTPSHSASYSSGVSTGLRPLAFISATARNSALPPSMTSVPRPAMLVATVTEPTRPAWATIAASRAWFFALSTSCLMPRLARSLERYSLFSTLVVPTSTGWPDWWRRAMSSTTWPNLACSFL
jgi:preprotein translocase subunit SecA